MKNAFKYSIPVAFGYVPLGIAFGILFNQTGYNFIYAILMAIFIFAGSAQFMAIGMLTSHAPIMTIFITTLLLNLRHVFYSLYALNLYHKLPFFKKLYAMQSLTDETFSIISTLPQELKNNSSLLLKLSFINHIWWVLGCSIGALVGYSANIKIVGLEFSLTALFIVLLLEQYFKSKKIHTIILAIIASVIALFIFKGHHFLIISLIITIAFFMGDKIYAKLYS